MIVGRVTFQLMPTLHTYHQLHHPSCFVFFQIRCYEVQDNQVIPKLQQSHNGPILDCCWHSVCLLFGYLVCMHAA